jgi:hypothetical protein
MVFLQQSNTRICQFYVASCQTILSFLATVKIFQTYNYKRRHADSDPHGHGPHATM